MSYFVWTPELSLGIDEIDEEHMKWIAYINALHVGVEAGKEQEILETLLEDAINFSKEHFEHEQSLFSKTKYEKTEEHIKLHEGFLKELYELKERLIKEDASVLTDEVMTSLKKWLIEHVQEVDREYASYVKENAVKE